MDEELLEDGGATDVGASATDPATSTPGAVGVGSDVERREDPRLLTGRATFLDDLSRPGMTYMAVVRSRYSHARIHGVDASAAEAMDGVLGVYTAADLDEAGVPGDIPTIYRIPGVKDTRHPILARDHARYQGKPIAVVVAEDRYVAHQARDAVDVDYERLESVVTPEEALADDAPTLHEEAPDNVSFEWEKGTPEATDEAFAEADRTFEYEWEQPRIIPNPLDPRGALAEYDGVDDELTVHLPSQFPFTHQELMAVVLDHPKRKIRVQAPEVGGGFGAKAMFYPGEALTAFCAMQLERPVKWIETRTGSMMSDEHGRGQHIECEIALDEDDVVTGMRIQTTASLGGDLSSKGVVGPTTTFGPLTSGQYSIPAIHFQSRGVFTNQTPTATYRGVGRVEAAYNVERAMTCVAREIGRDPVEFRRGNFVQPEEFPYQTALGSTYDSGDYEASLEAALEMVGYDEWRAKQQEAREEGRYLGIGVSCFIEPGGFGPGSVADMLGVGLPDSTLKTGFWESATVRVHETGEVSAYCGTAGHGQGTETTHAQVVADVLGVAYDSVDVTEGKDTANASHGSGTFGSRGAVMGGSAIAKSAGKVIEKGRAVAAHHLEAAPEDVEFDRDEGTFHVAGSPQRSMTLTDVAEQAYLGIDLPEGMEPGFEATTYFDPENLVWSFGTHVAVVEVDPRSGEIEFERYVAVDDCGTQINPTIVEGQIEGGVAQGIGAALYEDTVYDENGTLLTGSLQDYALPKAEHIPPMELGKTETPSPLNPLGVKGVGESGTVAAVPAVVNAVTDALEPFGVDHVDIPLTPEKVWRAIHDGE